MRFLLTFTQALVVLPIAVADLLSIRPGPYMKFMNVPTRQCFVLLAGFAHHGLFALALEELPVALTPIGAVLAFGLLSSPSAGLVGAGIGNFATAWHLCSFSRLSLVLTLFAAMLIASVCRASLRQGRIPPSPVRPDWGIHGGENAIFPWVLALGGTRACYLACHYCIKYPRTRNLGVCRVDGLAA